MKKNIVGIQQIGIGVPNVHEGFKWYRQNFGMDIPIFEEAAEANLMLPYTGGKPHKRHAILAINMKGGGGFEIWQYTSRTPQPSTFQIELGDLGMLCTRMKSENIKASYEFLKSKKSNLLTEIVKDPNGSEHFFLNDPFGNLFQIVEGNDWFGNGKQLTGGPSGCMIGVSDIEKSKKFYSEILGYDKIVYDKEGIFDDLKNISGGKNKFRRVLLTHSKPRVGSFSKLLGSSSMELIQVYNKTPRKIFENRFWGDLGFIHLCFDVTGMDALKKEPARRPRVEELITRLDEAMIARPSAPPKARPLPRLSPLAPLSGFLALALVLCSLISIVEFGLLVNNIIAGRPPTLTPTVVMINSTRSMESSPELVTATPTLVATPTLLPSTPTRTPFPLSP